MSIIVLVLVLPALVVLVVPVRLSISGRPSPEIVPSSDQDCSATGSVWYGGSSGTTVASSQFVACQSVGVDQVNVVAAAAAFPWAGELSDVVVVGVGLGGYEGSSPPPMPGACLMVLPAMVLEMLNMMTARILWVSEKKPMFAGVLVRVQLVGSMGRS